MVIGFLFPFDNSMLHKNFQAENAIFSTVSLRSKFNSFSAKKNPKILVSISVSKLKWNEHCRTHRQIVWCTSVHNPRHIPYCHSNRSRNVDLLAFQSRFWCNYIDTHCYDIDTHCYDIGQAMLLQNFQKCGPARASGQWPDHSPTWK